MARKAIWECGLGGEESDLGVWIRWRGKRFEMWITVGREESDLGVWIRWRGK